MNITEAQDREFRSIFETPLAIKLGLGSNFQRKILCTGVTAMGVGIVSPKT